MACAICETRRPRRFCPGVRGDICSICCGTEREVTVDCPLDCEYLQEARRHDKARSHGSAAVAQPRHPGFRGVSARTNEDLLTFLWGERLAAAAMRGSGDGRFRRPGGLGRLDPHLPYACKAASTTRASRPIRWPANVYRAVQAGARGIPAGGAAANWACRKTRDCRCPARPGLSAAGSNSTANNGRRRGRAFLDALREFLPAGARTVRTRRLHR